MDDYQPLLIRVSTTAGCYSSSLTYGKPFDTNAQYGLLIKHAPFSISPKPKNIIKQEWKDQNGDDVYLPSTVVYEAYDLELEFVYFEPDNNANAMIRQFIADISGKWLKIYDTYTNIGRQAVYLEEVEEDPTFKRRNGRDCLVFKVKFRVNDPNTNVQI